MKSILFFLALTVTFLSFSQSTINNLDFEDGNFNNWTTINGTVNLPPGHGARPFSFLSYGILNPGNYNQASHYIIDSLQYDPNIPLIKTLCPFTNSYSTRLGDFNGGGEAPRLEKLISIDSTISNLDFFFALVMNDPAHPPHEQPYLFVELYDSSGGVLTLIDSIFVVGGDPILTTATGSWKYIDWNHQQFNLSPYLGKKVLLRITNADCGYGAHGGTVYFDFSMDSKNQFFESYLCSSTDSVMFRGNSYDSVGVYRDTVWSGTIVDSVFTLTIRGIIQIPTSASLTNYNLCTNPTVFDIDCHVIGGTLGSFNYSWIVDGAIQQSGVNPHLTYTTTTNDTIYCLVTQLEGNCFNLFTDTLIVGPSISSPSVSLSSGGIVINATILGGKAPFAYSWQVNSTTSTTTSSSITPSVNGNYYVTVTDANGCTSQDSIIGYYMGIEELESNFSFYPNPASSSICLELKGEIGKIEIMDVNGKIVQKTQVFSDKELKLEDLEKGVYLLRFVSERGTSVTKKLLIE